MRNNKEKPQTIINSKIEELELTAYNNNLNYTYKKTFLVEEEHCFVVPWQQIEGNRK